MTPPQNQQLSPITALKGTFTYAADGLATIHNCEFLSDPKFVESYKLGLDTIRHQRPDLHVEWRTHIACWAAAHGLRLEGDFVECGVNTGIYSRAIMHYIDFENHAKRNFWLLDTYQGMPVAQMSEAERALGRERSNAKYPDCYEQVKKTFSDFPNVRIIKGVVPDTLAQVTAGKICYLSIDMNLVLPEIAAAEYFWDKLVTGAVMLLDDYGFAAHYEQKKAFDAFAARKSVTVLSLPTGQGIILKP